MEGVGGVGFSVKESSGWTRSFPSAAEGKLKGQSDHSVIGVELEGVHNMAVCNRGRGGSSDEVNLVLRNSVR